MYYTHTLFGDWKRREIDIVSVTGDINVHNYHSFSSAAPSGVLIKRRNILFSITERFSLRYACVSYRVTRKYFGKSNGARTRVLSGDKNYRDFIAFFFSGKILTDYSVIVRWKLLFFFLVSEFKRRENIIVWKILKRRLSHTQTNLTVIRFNLADSRSHKILYTRIR